MTKEKFCQVYDLGTIEYNEALNLQDKLVLARIRGEFSDAILFLEHPSVITIGVFGSEKNIVAPGDMLMSRGIPVLRVDRGGDVTYHGPGQLIGYAIFDLKAKGIGLHQYVRGLEEVIIRTLDVFAIPASRDLKYPGVWVEREKICALGIRVTKWVTKHGFALNVNTDLSYFKYIVPCGISDRQVTSMSKVLGSNISLRKVITCLSEQFANIFEVTIEHKTIDTLERILCPVNIHRG